MARDIEWTISEGLTDYASALARMEARVAAIADAAAPEWVWLLQHPPLYTAGTSARAADLLSPERFPVHSAGRGGQYTYHGPGQRVVYVLLDLRRRGSDVRCYVHALEQWLIDSLALLGVDAGRRAGRVGVWVQRDDGREDKIGAIGVRVRKWVTFHGAAINVDPDLSHYAGIVPCGILEHGVTSLADLGRPADLAALDEALHRSLPAFLARLSGCEVGD